MREREVREGSSPSLLRNERPWGPQDSTVGQSADEAAGGLGAGPHPALPLTDWWPRQLAEPCILHL